MNDQRRAPLSSLPEPLDPGGRGAQHGWPWQADVHDARSDVSWPTISVVTPSFNQGEYLEAAMRSVLGQGYPQLEYIVLDGGSTDNSVRVIEHYDAHLAHWHSGADDGQADAIARGFDRCTGEILCWLNSDDLLLPGALHHVARLFTRRPTRQFVYGNRLVIDARGRIVDRHIWPRYLTRWHWALGQPMAQECCFWTRELYRRVGGIARERFFTLDHDLFYRMSRVAKLHKTSAVLGCLRIHEQTKNALHLDVWERELATACAEFGLRKPGPLMARAINHLDRITIARENRHLPPLAAGKNVSDVYAAEVAP